MDLWSAMQTVIGTQEIYVVVECLLRSLLSAETPGRRLKLNDQAVYRNLLCSTVDLSFEQVDDGLESGTLIYLDVRERLQVLTEGRVVGSLVIPSKKFSSCSGRCN